MLSIEQENIVYGALLGDAQVQRNGASHRIRFEYALEAKQYVHWLVRKLEPYVLKVIEFQVYDKRTKKHYKKIRFDTITYPIFSKYQPMFDSNPFGSKDVVPSNIKEILATVVVLAVWVLDDGTKRTDSNAYRLHTENFTLKGVNMLQEALLEHYGIETTLHRHRNKESQQPADRGFLIAIGSRGGYADRFRATIQGFVDAEIPNLNYKFFQPCND